MKAEMGREGKVSKVRYEYSKYEYLKMDLRQK